MDKEIVKGLIYVANLLDEKGKLEFADKLDKIITSQKEDAKLSEMVDDIHNFVKGIKGHVLYLKEKFWSQQDLDYISTSYKVEFIHLVDDIIKLQDSLKFLGRTLGITSVANQSLVGKLIQLANNLDEKNELEKADEIDHLIKAQVDKILNVPIEELRKIKVTEAPLAEESEETGKRFREYLEKERLKRMKEFEEKQKRKASFLEEEEIRKEKEHEGILEGKEKYEEERERGRGFTDRKELFDWEAFKKDLEIIYDLVEKIKENEALFMFTFLENKDSEVLETDFKVSILNFEYIVDLLKNKILKTKDLFFKEYDPNKEKKEEEERKRKKKEKERLPEILI